MIRLNNIIISGRLTREPDLKFAQSGTAIVKIAIAVNRSFRKGENWEEEVSYFDIVMFGESGERIAQKLSKGSPVVVEGYLKSNTYQNKEGKNVKTTDIVAHKIQLQEKPVVNESQQPQDDDQPF